MNNWFIRFAITLSTSQVNMVKNNVGSPRSTSFISFFHIGAIFCFFQAILMSSTHTDKNNHCFSMNKQTCTERYFFPSRFQQNFLELSFPHSSRWWVSGTNFVQEEPLDLSVCPRFWPFMSRRIHTSGHSDFGILNNLGASSIFSSVHHSLVVLQ